ncbi:MAG: neutral/alkaline non-lysosomal ceramidase N-terminal domain-containing protein [Dehalococcoidia bacterium]
MTLTAGAASVVTTPPVGTPMEGYSARADVSQGVHDDLHARALVLDDAEGAVAVVACDLLGVDRRMVARARQLAGDATGIAPERILIAGTHTHSGPVVLARDPDDPLLQVLAGHIAGAIAAAYRARRPAVLKAGSTTVASVSQNRRHPDWPVDTTLSILLLDDPDPASGAPPIAAAINFACHATVLYHTNLLLSADYAGAAVRTVERVFPGVGALLLNGACGNVNPAWIVQDYSEAERVGAVVGAAAARLIGELRPLGPGQRAHNIRWDEHIELPVSSGALVPDVRLRAASRRVELPVKTFLPQDEYDSTLRELEARLAASPDRDERRRVMEPLSRLRTERTVASRMAGRDRPISAELQAIGLGEGLALLGLPGEFFVETVADIRQRSGLRHLPVACYANHYVGYVVPPAAYDEGGYESGVTWLAPEAEGIVKHDALSLLREVAG